MKLIINGNDHEAPDGCTLRELLVQIDLAEKPVVIELNQEALSPSAYDATNLNHGDRLEIVTIAAGG